jgi:hypothetical protein
VAGVSQLLVDRDRFTFTPYHFDGIINELAMVDSGFASQTMTANLAYITPFQIGAPMVVSGFAWVNGATAAGQSDMAIYDFAGTTKLATAGATSNSGTSTIQHVNITDVTLPGMSRYWLAYASNDGTHTVQIANPSAILQGYLGLYQQSSAWSSGLLSTITPAAPTVAQIPLVGFLSGAVI